MNLFGPPNDVRVFAIPGRSSSESAQTRRWVLLDNRLQMLPSTSARRPFNWAYLVARALRRLNPTNYL